MAFRRHSPCPEDSPKTTLFVSHWTPPDDERRREIDECLLRNIDCSAIDRIVLLYQSTAEHRATVPASPKLLWIELPSEIIRPRYSNFFRRINECTTTPWDLNIVANSDVFFDGSLSALSRRNLFGVCVTLTRWEWRNGEADSLAGDNSQDCWIFQGPVRPLAESTDIPLGIFGCDWRIAWILRHNNYVLVNVPNDIRHYHIHDSPYRNNGNMLAGPYHSSVPHQRLSDVHLPFGRHDRGGLLAYSIWGDACHYNFGIIENARMAKWIYPDWTVRVYVDESTRQDTIEELRMAAADVVQAPRWQKWRGGMFWRLLASDDPGFRCWGIRDADSRLTYRERIAIESWLESGIPLHTVRDHPAHERPVMLCAFDGRRGAVCDMAGQIDAWRLSGHGDGYGSDEQMVEESLWPTIRSRTLVHTEFGNRFGHGGVIRSFPLSSEEGFRFIGERIYEDNHHNGDDRDQYVRARWTEPASVTTREDLLGLIPTGSIIAEVGVFQGEFAERIMNCCKPTRLHLIDLWHGSASSGDKDGRNVIDVKDMESVFGELTLRFQTSPQICLHRGDSVALLSGFPDHSLDAAYLDSSHEYHATLAELEILFRKIRLGGWLMGHDYHPSCPVWPAVNEWCSRNEQKIAWLTRDDQCPSFAIQLRVP